MIAIICHVVMNAPIGDESVYVFAVQNTVDEITAANPYEMMGIWPTVLKNNVNLKLDAVN